MPFRLLAVVALASVLPPGRVAAQSPSPAAPAAAKAGFDEGLARSVGADDYGMRTYVLVILKTGPTKVPAGAERDAMFKGHMANITRLSNEGKLPLAGPFAGGAAGTDGWRGLFVFAVADVEEAKRLVASDPVIQKGEMVAEFHPWYGSAAVMLVPDAHKKVSKKEF